MKQRIIATLFVFALFFGANLAFAQTGNMPRSLEQVQGNENIQNRCEIVVKKIDTHLTRYKNNYERHQKIYAGMRDRVQSLIKKLEDKKYDVTKLKTDLKTLDEKLKKLDADYKAYIKQLEETKQFVCGESEGQFMSELIEARTKLKAVHLSIVDIRNFYQTTIRADIQALRKAAVEKDTESSLIPKRTNNND